MSVAYDSVDQTAAAATTASNATPATISQRARFGEAATAVAPWDDVLLAGAEAADTHLDDAFDVVHGRDVAHGLGIRELYAVDERRVVDVGVEVDDRERL